MTDILDAGGLQVASADELITELQSAFKKIYGDDILLDSSTPDGQLINIMAQKGVDVRGLLLQLYNSFNPENVQGALLDQRCAINNIFRKQGLFTTVTLDITTDRVLTLQGVDNNYNSPEATGYTVQDDEGNQFILANTTTFQAGTTKALFRAADLGDVVVLPNTITTPVTIVLGVISVNNPTAANEIGYAEESDSDLRLRRRQSVAIGSFGYLNGLQAALLQLEGVNDAKVYENYTSETDENGIPGHCIWVVVDGGRPADIGNTIYAKKNPGCNMKGSIEYTIITPALTEFVAKWDNATIKNLYIKFTIKKVADVTYDQSAIKEYIEKNLTFKIGDYAETASITDIAQKAVESAGGNGYAINVLISNNHKTWVEYLAPVVGTKYTIAGIDITEA